MTVTFITVVKCVGCKRCSRENTHNPVFVTHMCQSSTQKYSRRQFLRHYIQALSVVSLFAAAPFKATAKDRETDKVCSYCQGKGKVTCDMCQGTGFWKALTTQDQYQKYKGETCPQCMGLGYLTCPVCLGTGEANVRGMLRRGKKIGSGKGLFSTE